MNQCTIEDCTDLILATGLCSLHYSRKRSARKGKCTEDGCDKNERSMGMCYGHYKEHRLSLKIVCPEQGCENLVIQYKVCSHHYFKRKMETNPICESEGCTNPQRSSKLCYRHYAQKYRSEGGTCSLDGCDRYEYVQSYCTLHYNRLKKTGTVGTVEVARPTYGMTEDDRFNYYTKTESTGCVLWEGRTTAEYGLFSLTDGRDVPAHRFSYARANGLDIDMLKGFTVHHKCAVRACVNPDHLELATHRENVGEMFARSNYILAIEKAIETIEALDPTNDTLPMLRLVITSET